MGGIQPPSFASPLGMGVGMGGGMGRGMGHMGQPSFLGGSPMGYRQPSPFGLGSPNRSQPIFPSRHRNHHHSQSPWSQSRRSPFSSSFFDDDEDDESDYETSSAYGYPRRRGEGFRQLGRSPYQNRCSPGSMYGRNDGYEEYGDLEDDSDDESDLEDFYPQTRRRQPRY